MTNIFPFLGQSTTNAERIASDGIAYLHANMVFERDGVDMKLKDAMDQFVSSPKVKYQTGVIKVGGTPVVLFAKRKIRFCLF